MLNPAKRSINAVILDEAIYPRKGIDHRRVGIFAENIRDGFTFDPIEVEPCPDKPGWYRLLDGAHRWSALGFPRKGFQKDWALFGHRLFTICRKCQYWQIRQMVIYVRR